MASRLLITYAIFAIAMAYLESAIVVYLRLLYYPNGFQFPLFIIPAHVTVIEIGREIATIVTLWFAARMAGKNFKERFSLFIFTFGVWDIFYYVWLKILINWPTSWLEWDILFLIPVPWIGPWLAPALVSSGFIFAAYLILSFPDNFPDKILLKWEWWAEIACASLILTSFFWETQNVIAGEVPGYYPWWLFAVGIIGGLAIFLRRLVH